MCMPKTNASGFLGRSGLASCMRKKRSNISPRLARLGRYCLRHAGPGQNCQPGGLDNFAVDITMVVAHANLVHSMSIAARKKARLLRSSRAFGLQENTQRRRMGLLYITLVGRHVPCRGGVCWLGILSITSISDHCCRHCSGYAILVLLGIASGIILADSLLQCPKA